MGLSLVLACFSLLSIHGSSNNLDGSELSVFRLIESLSNLQSTCGPISIYRNEKSSLMLSLEGHTIFQRSTANSARLGTRHNDIRFRPSVHGHGALILAVLCTKCSENAALTTSNVLHRFLRYCANGMHHIVDSVRLVSSF